MKSISFFLISFFLGCVQLFASETVVVKERDTLSQIALTHFGHPVYGAKGSISKLLKLNPDVQNIHQIRPGQKIRVTQVEAISQVKVERGDTLSELAQKYFGPKVYGKRGSLEQLLALNPQFNISTIIHPGQIVHLGNKNPDDSFEVEPVLRILDDHGDTTVGAAEVPDSKDP